MFIPKRAIIFNNNQDNKDESIEINFSFDNSIVKNYDLVESVIKTFFEEDEINEFNYSVIFELELIDSNFLSLVTGDKYIDDFLSKIKTNKKCFIQKTSGGAYIPIESFDERLGMEDIRDRSSYGSLIFNEIVFRTQKVSFIKFKDINNIHQDDINEYIRYELDRYFKKQDKLESDPLYRNIYKKTGKPERVIVFIPELDIKFPILLNNLFMYKSFFQTERMGVTFISSKRSRHPLFGNNISKISKIYVQGKWAEYQSKEVGFLLRNSTPIDTNEISLVNLDPNSLYIGDFNVNLSFRINKKDLNIIFIESREINKLLKDNSDVEFYDYMYSITGNKVFKNYSEELSIAKEKVELSKEVDKMRDANLSLHNENKKIKKENEELLKKMNHLNKRLSEIENEKSSLNKTINGLNVIIQEFQYILDGVSFTEEQIKNIDKILANEKETSKMTIEKLFKSLGRDIKKLVNSK